MAAILRVKEGRTELVCTVPNVQGGKVTSTMVNCWMAAILRVDEGRTELVCTGTLIQPDLVVTTASCINM